LPEGGKEKIKPGDVWTQIGEFVEHSEIGTKIFGQLRHGVYRRIASRHKPPTRHRFVLVVEGKCPPISRYDAERDILHMMACRQPDSCKMTLLRKAAK
jgi:hypothetical protein